MLLIIITTALSSLLCGFAVAVPLHSRNETTCSDPVTRVEWRSLSTQDRDSYLDAVLCLKTKPSRIGLDTPLYDDFPYVHSTLNGQIHFVASFLPWHRYFLHIYRLALQDCGYTGPTPYWDWTLDTNAFAVSPLFQSSHGFGGNGDANTSEALPGSGLSIDCVSDGPFANLRLAYYQECARCGPGAIEHCLHRDWISGTADGAALALQYNATAVANVQALPDFLAYHGALEQGPHTAVHSAIGGDMNPGTSPNEPLFFLHHAQVDRLWWLWQQQDPETRLYDYSGNRMVGSRENDASLEDLLVFQGLAGNVTVTNVMDTLKGDLCYTY